MSIIETLRRIVSWDYEASTTQPGLWIDGIGGAWQESTILDGPAPAIQAIGGALGETTKSKLRVVFELDVPADFAMDLELTGDAHAVLAGRDFGELFHLTESADLDIELAAGVEWSFDLYAIEGGSYDLLFLLDGLAGIMPAPEPSAFLLGVVALLTLALFRRFTQWN